MIARHLIVDRGRGEQRLDLVGRVFGHYGLLSIVTEPFRCVPGSTLSSFRFSGSCPVTRVSVAALLPPFPFFVVFHLMLIDQGLGFLQATTHIIEAECLLCFIPALAGEILRRH